MGWLSDLFSGSSEQTQTRKSSVTPWQPVSGALNDFASSLKAPAAGLTPSEQGAVNKWTNVGKAGHQFIPQMDAVAQGLLTPTDYGRDHHPRCFTLWAAGGGIKPGITYGRTDDFSYNILENPVDVHDLHATLLHLLGIDHRKLIYRHEGRDYRLTDVSGQLVRPIIA